ncbi:MAG TPA: Ig-like domain repeat protein [Acidobacteriaceae bacterium]|nr:Ig-like domain repeat protein [Acidobacteriaceae bacterium]
MSEFTTMNLKTRLRRVLFPLPLPAPPTFSPQFFSFSNVSLITLWLAFAAFATQTVHAQGVASVQFQSALPLVSAPSPDGPFGVAVDKAGNLFLTDYNNSRVLEVPAGCVSTACQIVVQTSGLNNPTAVALDANGDVFVADYHNNRIVEVPRSSTGFGTQVTLPSTGQNLPTGLAVDHAGDLYIANNDYTGTTPSRVIELPWNGSSYGAPVTIVNWLTNPSGLAMDGSGDLFVTDVSANKVVELPPGCVSSACQILVPTGATVNDPGVTTDLAGDVFIASFGSNEVLEVPHGCSSTACQMYVGHGMNEPAGVAVDGFGNIFIADYANNQIEKVNQNSLSLGAVNIGSSAGATAEFTFNSAVTLNTTTPYSVLTQGATGLDFSDAGGSTCAGTAYSAGQSCIVKVTFLASRTGVANGAAVLFDSNGNPIATAYLSGIGLGPQLTFRPGTQAALGSGLQSASGVALDRKGNIYVADSLSRTVEELVAPAYTTVVPLGGTFSFSNPVSLALDAAGNIFVADKGSASIDEILAPAYTTVNALGSGFNAPSGVAVDGSGNVYVADSGNNAIKEMPEAGGYASVATLAISFSSPAGVAVDGGGNVFVADTGNNAVKEIVAIDGQIPPSPTINTLASGFSAPSAVALDSVANLYVADAGNAAIKELTVADGYATATSLKNNLANSSSVALDSIGNVYVGSFANSQIVKLDFADLPSAQVGVPYNEALTAIGGTAPYTFTLTGTLPAGVAFNAGTATLSGTPTAAGSFPVSVTVADSNSHISTVNYMLTVNLGTPVLTFAPIPAQTYGNAPFTVSGTSASNGAVTYSILAGPANVNPTSGLVTLTGAGQVTIQASQAPTASYNAAAAQTSFNVARQRSVTSINASPLIISLGGKITLTASVAPAVSGAPTGTVTFYDGKTQIGTAVSLTNGKATLVWSNPGLGLHSITAVYSGDKNFLGSSSPASSPITVLSLGL